MRFYQAHQDHGGAWVPATLPSLFSSLLLIKGQGLDMGMKRDLWVEDFHAEADLTA